jgi:hypothetical protein
MYIYSWHFYQQNVAIMLLSPLRWQMSDLWQCLVHSKSLYKCKPENYTFWLTQESPCRQVRWLIPVIPVT